MSPVSLDACTILGDMIFASAIASFVEPQPHLALLPWVEASFTKPIVSLLTADPWAWSLDTVVAMVGALASAAVAIVAIVLTNNRAKVDYERQTTQILDERRLRERVERKIVGEAALAYMKSVDERGARRSELDHLERALADADVPEEPFYRWVIESSKTRADAEFIAHEEADPDSESEKQPLPSWLAYKALDSEMRGRIREWIRTGEMDTAPLVYPPPNSRSAK
jgi:hypothetical protein